MMFWLLDRYGKPLLNRWIGNDDEEPIFWISKSIELFGWQLRLHYFVKGDGPGCFHTHQSWNVRLILAGGYIEETKPDIKQEGGIVKRRWRPGMIGVIGPDYCHSVSELLMPEKGSWSLWLRGPTIKKAEFDC